MGNVEGGQCATGAGWMDGLGSRRREEEIEVGAAGTILACSWPFFLACLAHGRVTSRLGEVLRMPDGRMGADFEVEVMRRLGRRAFWYARGRVLRAFGSRTGGVEGGQDVTGAGWMDRAGF
jgi:hypothetical protein